MIWNKNKLENGRMNELNRTIEHYWRFFFFLLLFGEVCAVYAVHRPWTVLYCGDTSRSETRFIFRVKWKKDGDAHGKIKRRSRKNTCMHTEWGKLALGETHCRVCVCVHARWDTQNYVAHGHEPFCAFCDPFNNSAFLFCLYEVIFYSIHFFSPRSKDMKTKEKK